MRGVVVSVARSGDAAGHLTRLHIASAARASFHTLGTCLAWEDTLSESDAAPWKGDARNPLPRQASWLNSVGIPSLQFRSEFRLTSLPFTKPRSRAHHDAGASRPFTVYYVPCEPDQPTRKALAQREMAC